MEEETTVYKPVASPLFKPPAFPCMGEEEPLEEGHKHMTMSLEIYWEADGSPAEIPHRRKRYYKRPFSPLLDEGRRAGLKANKLICFQGSLLNSLGHPHGQAQSLGVRPQKENSHANPKIWCPVLEWLYVVQGR